MYRYIELLIIGITNTVFKICYFSLLNGATGLYLSPAKRTPDPPTNRNCARLILFAGLLHTYCHATRLRNRRWGLSLIQPHNLSCRTTTFRMSAPPTSLLHCKGEINRGQTGILFSSQQTPQQNIKLCS